MTMKERLKMRRLERNLKKDARKNILTWVHRYFRLHIELLEDGVYKEIYEYHRKTLIEYLKRDLKGAKLDDTQLGELVDSVADIFNKNAAERVNKYKSLVDELYIFWQENPDVKDDIFI
ncbi:MAG: hypothetical protein IJ506_01270 [Clostridia bacterium]|nr:hypothetical protein [Clostridia bacterium]